MRNPSAFDNFIHGGRVIAAFAMGGAVFGALTVGWIPAFALVDVHMIGAVIGGVAGAVANARHLV